MSLICRTFARNLGKPIKAVKKSEPEPVQEVTLEWMAGRNEHIQSLPKSLEVSAKALFSGYSTRSIRDWGYKLAQYYTEIHGVEKPRDITNIQPFVTALEAVEEKTRGSHRRGFYKLSAESGEKAGGKGTPLLQSTEVGVSFHYQAEHAVGYAYKRMPNSYASAYRILREIKYRMPEFQPQNVLDYGAGTGACSWAATQVFPDAQCVAIEPAKEMRTVGKKLSRKQPNIRWADSLASLPSVADPEGLFDVVICSYVLAEVENAVTRNLILDALWQRTKRVLIFVEPGTPKGFRIIHSIREWAVKTMTRDEANIIAPCPHDGPCALAANPKSWCHFSQFTAKYSVDTMARVKGEVDSENEKYSYIAISRGTIPRYYPAGEKLNLAEKSFLWPRLIRPTIRSHKHVTFDICRENKIERMVLSKGKTDKVIYRFIRKAHWGDLWPYTETKKQIDNNKEKVDESSSNQKEA